MHVAPPIIREAKPALPWGSEISRTHALDLLHTRPSETDETNFLLLPNQFFRTLRSSTSTRERTLSTMRRLRHRGSSSWSLNGQAFFQDIHEIDHVLC